MALGEKYISQACQLEFNPQNHLLEVVLDPRERDHHSSWSVWARLFILVKKESLCAWKSGHIEQKAHLGFILTQVVAVYFSPTDQGPASQLYSTG